MYICVAVSGAATAAGGAKPKSKEVMELSRSNFLSMLKGDSAPPSSAASGSSVANMGSKKRDQLESDSDGEEQGKGGSAWGAVQDTYLTDRKLALKVVDRDVALSVVCVE